MLSRPLAPARLLARSAWTRGGARRAATPIATPCRLLSAPSAASALSPVVACSPAASASGGGGAAEPAPAAADAAAAAADTDTVWIVDRVIEGLGMIHDMTGMPWWATIAVGTVGIRTLLVPLAIKTIRNSVKMSIIKPEMTALQDQMKSDPRMQARDPMAVQYYQKAMKELFTRNDCSPFRGLIMPLVQAPIFMSMFFGLRRIGDTYPEVMTGGTLWFPDLTAMDPILCNTFGVTFLPGVLPIIASAGLLLNVELGAETGVRNDPNMDKMKTVMRFVSVAMLPVTYTFPTAVFVYWISTNTFSTVQILLLRSDALRTTFDIPKPPAVTPPADALEDIGAEPKVIDTYTNKPPKRDRTAPRDE